MKKKIKIELSEKSIQDAIDELNAYKLGFEPRLRQAMAVLCAEASEKLREFGGGREMSGELAKKHPEWFHVDYEITDTGFILTALGDQVGFMEFGTGAYADTQHPFAGDAPFPVWSGSYSDTVGAGTWDAWIRAGKPEDEYPYNSEPTRMLYQTSLWIEENWARIIKREMAREKK